jgi:hypothetical protein
VSLSGKERVLYSFKGVPDGDGPGSALIDVNGALYATTYGGGKGGRYGGGAGTKVSTSGAESVLYRFGGSLPVGPNGLVAVNGALYGTTQSGGGSGCTGGYGCGTVFKIAP